ncbi:hypothetical protein C8N24_4539 [Solirubrobacter pauli]|uniref:Uncharacterized protein n=1 Tax=Solirubrobacter pauli TaxID=166793 RepID=A0A660KXX6_9ACTN|nr:hypothetical protein [Solirubrobacter pauli]RKQ86526.1 hypothetical protein C8N24_4539 [Solirubrobacter pauli]
MRALLTWPRLLVARPRWWFVAVLVAIPAAFLVDGTLDTRTQWLLAALAWWALLGAIGALTPAERGQTLLLVALATAAELTFSLVLEWYAYRLDNVPPWIPPAHGIVFVTALLWSKDPLAERRQDTVRVAVTAAAVTYGALALVLADDVGGALGVGLLLIWLWALGADRARFYAMMWLVVCYLEACGVLIGTWAWAPTVPLIGVPEANPPSGIVGVYGFFDLLALAVVTRYFTVRSRNLANA